MTGKMKGLSALVKTVAITVAFTERLFLPYIAVDLQSTLNEVVKTVNHV